jgi:hypothetical protein
MFFSGIVLTIALFYPRPVYAEPVTEREATEIAEFWYPAEVNFRSQYGKIPGNGERTRLLNESGIRAVRYLLSSRELADKIKGNQQALAYVIEFYPKGFVVLSGDDIFSPVLAHSLDSDFFWQDDCSSFSTSYLRNTAYAMSVELFKESGTSTKTNIHTGWSNLRSLNSSQKNLSAEQKSFAATSSSSDTSSIESDNAPSGGVAPLAFGDELVELLDTAKWSQGGYYNDSLSTANGFTWVTPPAQPLNFPRDIMTGCNTTALAIIMRYHQWPYRAVGSYTHNDFSYSGNVHGSVTIDTNVTFNWANMPLDNIDDSASPYFGANADIADLMWRAGGLTDANWELGGTSGGWQPNVYTNNLRYKDQISLDAMHTGNIPEANCVHVPIQAWDYFYCPTQRTWADANNHCTAVGMNLVRIFSEDENANIGNEITSLGWSKAWIGATDSASEGVWRWTDNNDQFWQGNASGHSVDDLYSNWRAGQPNNNGDEDCAEITSSDYEWYDFSCSNLYSYICEAHLDSTPLIPYFTWSLGLGLPIYAGVDRPYCGHAVVIDGYEKDLATGEVQFRVNPGHGNGDEGYFTTTTFPHCRFLSSGLVFMTPENYMYVYLGGSAGDGGPYSPFNTVSSGINAIPTPDANNPYGGRLMLHSGSYSSFSFSKPMEVSNYLGDVTINSKVTIRNWGVIRRGSGGAVTIN